MYMYVHAGRDVNKPSTRAALCAERALFMAVTACVSSELLFFLLGLLKLLLSLLPLLPSRGSNFTLLPGRPCR